MTETQLIDKMIAEYRANLWLFNSMARYYEGDHDINYDYHKYPKRANQVVIQNYVNLFVNEEVQYSLGNPISYVSMSGNKKEIDDISNHLFHWRDNHNQELMRTLEIYGIAYALNYVDAKGRFSERILNPENAIAYCDADGVPVRFIHFYQPKYEDVEYHDVYYPDGRILTYKAADLVKESKHPFSGIPVSICKLDNIKDTIYAKIKKMQDGYNEILSDQTNTISDFRRAFLIIYGVQVDDEAIEQMETKRVLNLPQSSNTGAKYLYQDLPDAFVENALERLRKGMYAVTNHIDGNEKLQSNTSGTALRNRLVFLEQRCNFMLTIVLNSIYDRIERLFEYLAIQGLTYDIKDIKIVSSPCVPQDEIGIVQELVQLGIGENISLETALSRIPFIENPAQEIEKIKAEKRTNKKLELDKLYEYGDPE